MLATPSEGFHLAYELRKDDRLKHVPIIILSAIGQATGMNYAREVGSDYLPVDRFLEKPFDARTLREAVSQVLHSQGARP
jgi:DNA-binding response OmpR family regulator